MRSLQGPLAYKSPEGAISEIALSKQKHTHAHRLRCRVGITRRKTDNPRLIFAMIIACDSPPLATTSWCSDAGWGGVRRVHVWVFERVPIILTTWLLSFFHPCARGRPQEWFNIHSATHCARHINAIHFLFSQTLLVMVRWGNWFPFQHNHRRCTHMYNMPWHKYDLCELKWVKKAVLYHIYS